MPYFKKVKESKSKGVKRGRSKNDKVKKQFFKKEDSDKSDEEISSSDEDADLELLKKGRYEEEDDEVVEDVETVEEKKERISKAVLEEIKQNEKISRSNKNIQKQLKDERLQSKGQLLRRMDANYEKQELYTYNTMQCKKLQRKEITCVAINPKDNSIFSSSIDGSIVKYSSNCVKVGVIKSWHQNVDKTLPAHKSKVTVIAISSNGKYLAAGDADATIHIWSCSTLEHVDVLKGHKNAVTGLVFQREGKSLFSCGEDRLVMEWNTESWAYVDNLGGHGCGVKAIDALYRHSCITCGGQDNTVIVFAIEDDQQHIFEPEKKKRQVSIDGVKLLNDTTFLTYSQDGSLSLWSSFRKTPLHTIAAAHGRKNDEPLWITALATLVNTDLVATGSMDGFVRLWQANAGRSTIRAVGKVPVPPGVVNSLAFSLDGTRLVAGIGRSHKEGRWVVVPKSKNILYAINFGGVKPLKNISLKKMEEQLAMQELAKGGQSDDSDMGDDNSEDMGQDDSEDMSDDGEDINDDSQMDDDDASDEDTGVNVTTNGVDSEEESEAEEEDSEVDTRAYVAKNGVDSEEDSEEEDSEEDISVNVPTNRVDCEEDSEEEDSEVDIRAYIAKNGVDSEEDSEAEEEEDSEEDTATNGVESYFDSEAEEEDEDASDEDNSVNVTTNGVKSEEDSEAEEDMSDEETVATNGVDSEESGPEENENSESEEPESSDSEVAVKVPRKVSNKVQKKKKKLL